jgi:hypothetical protein
MRSGQPGVEWRQFAAWMFGWMESCWNRPDAL